MRRRNKVIEYATVPRVVLSTEFLQASCRKSKSNVGCRTRSQGKRNLPTDLRMMRVYSNFSKISERQCMITRFVHGCGALTHIDKNNRWNDKLRSISKSVNSS